MTTIIVFAVALLAGAEGPAGGGLVPFEQSGSWGYKDVAGKVVIEPKYRRADEFSEGLALVDGGTRYRFLDATGKTVIDLGEASDAGSFREGLAPVYEDRSLKGYDWRTRFIDKKGKTVFTVDGYAREFHEGLAVLTVRVTPRSDASFSGYIDRTGKLAIPPRFAEAYDFSEGLAAVRPKRTTIGGMGDTWGYIDKTGNYAFPPRFNEAGPFQKGIAQVHVGGRLVAPLDMTPWWEGGKWQLIDRRGNVLKQSDKWIPQQEAIAPEQAESRKPKKPSP